MMSIFSVDSHFLIGRDHLSQGKPCQDYALTYQKDDQAYAVVSDGCSNGGLTDIGSRLTCLQALSLHKSYRSLSSLGDYLQRMAGILGLNDNDMLATCVSVRCSLKEAYIQIIGDGVVGIVLKGGMIRLHRFEWANNMPFYPIYNCGFLEQFYHHNMEVEYPFTEEIWTESKSQKHKYTIDYGIDGADVLIYNMDEVRSIAIFSDGVCQVDGIDWTTAATQLLAFKNTSGVFSKRRMNAFVRECEQHGKGPLDDIAYAVINVDQE